MRLAAPVLEGRRGVGSLLTSRVASPCGDAVAVIQLRAGTAHEAGGLHPEGGLLAQPLEKI